MQQLSQFWNLIIQSKQSQPTVEIAQSTQAVRDKFWTAEPAGPDAPIYHCQQETEAEGEVICAAVLLLNVSAFRFRRREWDRSGADSENLSSVNVLFCCLFCHGEGTRPGSDATHTQLWCACYVSHFIYVYSYVSYVELRWGGEIGGAGWGFVFSQHAFTHMQRETELAVLPFQTCWC